MPFASHLSQKRDSSATPLGQHSTGGLPRGLWGCPYLTASLCPHWVSWAFTPGPPRRLAASGSATLPLQVPHHLPVPLVPALKGCGTVLLPLGPQLRTFWREPDPSRQAAAAAGPRSGAFLATPLRLLTAIRIEWKLLPGPRGHVTGLCLLGLGGPNSLPAQAPWVLPSPNAARSLPASGLLIPATAPGNFSLGEEGEVGFADRLNHNQTGCLRAHLERAHPGWAVKGGSSHPAPAPCAHTRLSSKGNQHAAFYSLSLEKETGQNIARTNIKAIVRNIF